KLKAEDIKALVDLAGLTPGTHQLEVKVDISNKLQVLKVEPNKVEVTISNEG
ncbi:MAG: CdaR family protein, partial [Bacillota bacterium]